MLDRIASFWLGFFVAVVAFAAVSIYGFDYFAPGLGRGNSLLIAMLLAAMVGLVASHGFLVGIKVFAATPLRFVAAVAGMVVGAGTLLAMSSLDMFVSSASGTRLLVTVVAYVLSLLSAWVLRNRISRNTSKSQAS